MYIKIYLKCDVTASDSVLAILERTGEPYSGPTAPMSAGNGSLMRLAPVPMFFAGDAREAIDRSADSSRTTHGAVEAVDACRYFAGLLVGALRGVDKQTLLSEHYSPIEGLWDETPLAPKIAAIAYGSFKHKQPPEIRGTDYVVDTLEAVLWAFFHTEDFREGALKVVNLGDDADTTGAIFGQIAGAPLRRRVHPGRMAAEADDERRCPVTGRQLVSAGLPALSVTPWRNTGRMLCCSINCR